MQAVAWQVVIGLGKTGLACARYLAEQGYSVCVVDSRLQPPGLAALQQTHPDIPITLGAFDPQVLQKAERLIVSPGISLNEPAIVAAREQGIPVVGDIELFVQAARAPILAITGSNGKTTVTTLLGLMLQSAGYRVEVCGNIGTPVLEVLNHPTPDFYVVELSSFQLETTYSLKAAAAVILNLSPDHMDRYASEQAYLHAKQRIYQHCAAAIVNTDEPFIWRELSLPPHRYSFGFHQGEFHVCGHANDAAFLAYENHKLLPLSDMKLQGRHHVLNALATLAMGHAVGVPLEKMVGVLKDFAGLAHRCQWVAEERGVTWVNDSKGTNVGASVAALDTVGPVTKGKLILIAGGDSKAADLRPLCEPVKTHVRHVVLIGKDADLFQKILQGVVPLTRASTLQNAVAVAAQLAEAGDSVLLSPACASYDMFENFEHRGQCFIKAIQELYGKTTPGSQTEGSQTDLSL